jgi:hypothetical protein
LLPTMDRGTTASLYQLDDRHSGGCSCAHVSRPWLIGRALAHGCSFFQPQIPWREIGEDYTILLAVDATCFVAGIRRS